jgi:hypothetical protein
VAAEPAASGQLFQSFWAGGPLTPYEEACLCSFVDNGHRFELYSFDADLAVPAGVRLRPACEVLPAREFFVYQTEPNRGSPSAFANLFRYALLAARGGWWVDVDVFCLSPAAPDCDHFVARHDEELVNGGVMRLPASHPYMVECLDRARRAGRNVVWGETGPRLLTAVVKAAGGWEETAPPEACEAIPPSMALAPLKPRLSEICRSLTERSWCVHLWNSSLCTNRVDKTLLPPRGSFLRELFGRIPMTGWRGEYLAPVILPYDTLA